MKSHASNVTLLNVDEIKPGFKFLSKHFHVHRFEAPHKTFESRRVYGLRVGKHPRVFILSGIHGRERGGPDHVFNFASDLLAAQALSMDIWFGNRSYTKEQVATALSAGFVIVPLANPDGVAYDQETDSCWRKNRNTASATTGVPHSIGVDLNRNFNATWDYKRVFAPTVASKRGIASEDPSSDVFHGTAPLSEPETRNVDWVLSKYSSLSWFVDVHSAGGMVLFGWGDDDMQDDDPYQNFVNTTYDGTRGILDSNKLEDGNKYREYIRVGDALVAMNITQQMTSAMREAGSIEYRTLPLSSLYPVSGSSMDHALSKTYSDACPGRHSIISIGMEFGHLDRRQACPFYADVDGYHSSRNQVAAGLMEVLLEAAQEDLTLRTIECDETV